MTAVLGDFLRPARAHITAAARSGSDLPLPARRAVITELDRLVTTMNRYLDDLVLPADFTPASTADTEVRAALDGRCALRRAAASLHPAAAAVRQAGVDDAHPAAGHLSSANSYLAAGRDLLQTHFTTGSAGSTWWAPVITSPLVTAALRAELAACSRQLGAWTAQLSRTGSLYAGLPAAASQGLRDASRWLRTAANSDQAAHWRNTPAPARKLLLGIPAGFPPPRQPPSSAEPAPELCAGITVTAERLRHAVRTFAGQAGWSPAASSRSWRRHALASAITGHASELILRSLAERARQLDLSPAIRAQLTSAADDLSHTWPAFREIARHWDTISTGAHRGRDISPIASELDDLVLRTGRLAYDNPRWTPDRAGAGPARDPADLAATVSDVRIALGAVHHAIDAINHIAACDTDAVRDAISAGRLYLPTRLLPEHYDIPSPYAPAPSALAAELAGCYETAATAARRAAVALDELAVTARSPSSTLALARLSAGSPVTAPQPPDDDGRQTPAQAAPQPGVPQPRAGQVEDILHGLNITEPGMLLRAAAIDEATHDLLANATVSSRNRDSINQPPQRKPRTPDQAPRAAAKDVIHAGADTRQHAIPAGSAGSLNGTTSTRPVTVGGRSSAQAVISPRPWQGRARGSASRTDSALPPGRRLGTGRPAG